MKPIRYIVVDDEELARTLINNYAGRLDYLEEVASCKNPMEAMTVLREKQVDLLFLDIQMPELTGVEFLRSLQNRPLVVFTTAYPEYALEGYELDVVDYLLKPFSFERFFKAIQKVESRLQMRSPTVTSSHASNKILTIKADHKIYRVPATEIRFIQSMREYVAYYTENQGRILSLGSLKQLEQELPETEFLRVHRSYIVPVQKVQGLEGNRLLIGEDKIPIGAHYRKNVLQRLFPGKGN